MRAGLGFYSTLGGGSAFIGFFFPPFLPLFFFFFFGIHTIQGFPCLELFKQKCAGKSSLVGILAPEGGRWGIPAASKLLPELRVVFLEPLHVAAVLSPHRCPRLYCSDEPQSLPGPRVSGRPSHSPTFPSIATGLAVQAPGLTQTRQQGVWVFTPWLLRPCSERGAGGIWGLLSEYRDQA